MDFRPVVLAGCLAFFIFYLLYLLHQWLIIIGIGIVILACYGFYRIFKEDWDKKYGIDGKKEEKL